MMPDVAANQNDAAIARKRVGFVVSTALKNAAPHIAEADVARHAFVGLWEATIGLLLLNMEPMDVVGVLQYRCEKLPKFGANADSAVETVPENAVDARRAQIMQAADIFSSFFQQAFSECEEAGLQDYFPECVLDKTIEKLDSAWGPWHLRHALAEQAELIASGQGAVIDVLEPVRSAAVHHNGDTSKKRAPYPRAVVVRIDSAVSGDKPRWAYVMRTSAADGSEREETREARCPVPGANLDRAALAGALAAIKDIDADGPGASVVVETANASLLRGIASPSARPASDTVAWTLVDDLIANHQIDWRRIPADHDDLARRCAALLAKATST